MALEFTATEDLRNSIRDIIHFIGDNPDREGLVDTPKRLVRSWRELFSGYGQDPEEILEVRFTEQYDEIILLKDIEFYSTCEHHFLPFFGKIHIGYIPNGKVVGVSKLARLAEVYSRRLQLQERLTTQIATSLESAIKPQGVGVVCEATHLCMLSRGVQKQNSKVVTSAMFGVFRDSYDTRAEFLQLCLKQ